MEKHPQPQMGTEGDVIGARIGAFFIDGILVTVVFFVFFFLITALFGGLLSAGAGARGGAAAVFGSFFVFALVFPLVTFGYYIYMEGAYGYTLGKKLLNLVVVNEDGSPCTMTDSLIRNLLRIVDGLFSWLVGLILILVTERNQRVGDMAASTVVVRTASAAAQGYQQQQGYGGQQGYQQAQGHQDYQQGQGYQQGQQGGYQQQGQQQGGYQQQGQGYQQNQGYQQGQQQGQQGQRGQQGHNQGQGQQNDQGYDQVEPQHLDENDSSDDQFDRSDDDSSGGTGYDGDGGQK